MRFVATLLSLGMLLTARAATGQISDTDLQVSVSAGPEQDSHQLSGVGIGTADADQPVSFLDGRSYTAVAHALAGGGSDAPNDPPIAECEADINATGQITARARASSLFSYSVRVNGSPPPEVAVYYPSVYVRVSYYGETTLAGDISDTSDPFLRARATATFGISAGSPTQHTGLRLTRAAMHEPPHPPRALIRGRVLP